MKPRITSGWTSVWIGTWVDLHGWYCADGISSEWGATPKEAYEAWKRTASGSRQWRPGTVVEQHLCPPKPTIWQRIKRAWGSFDCAVYDRVC